MEFLSVIEAAKREVKGAATDEDRAFLTDPENRGVWIKALTAARDDVADQFDNARERLERARADAMAGVASVDAYRAQTAEFLAWSRKAARYKLGLEQRLTELRLGDEVELLALKAAIAQHRDARNGVGDPVDCSLWAALAN